MVRTLTATGLTLSTAFCGAAGLLFMQLYVKSAGADLLFLGLAAVFAAGAAGMWFAFRARKYALAWLVAAGPPLVGLYLLSQVKIRMF